MVLSKRLNNLSESATLAMSRMSRELVNQGVDVINLSLGEPDFETPEFIKVAAKNAIDNNFSHYTPVPGLLSLRKAICEKFKRDNNLTFDPDQIVVSNGAKQSLANICLCLLNQNDEVIIPAPYWVSYYEIIKLASGKPVVIPSDINNNFKVSAEEIEKKITKKTKIIIFSSPCNPSGSVYSEKELRSIARMLEKYPNVYLVSDEIYEHINFTSKHFSIGSIKKIKERTITVNGVSKGFAMTGWRIGFIGAPLNIAKGCIKIQGQITSGASSVSQKAAEKAILSNPIISTKLMKETFRKRRDFIFKEFSKIENIKLKEPQGAFYLFPDVSKYLNKRFKNYFIKNVTDLCMYILNEGHVALVAGDAFGNPNCIRISYAVSEKKLIIAIKRINKVLKKLK